MSALTLAVPSKGRLKEQTEEFFRDAGYAIAPLGGARGYLARIPALPEIEVRLLSASEIASGVIAGDIHCGISGEDLLREQAGDLERVAHLLAPLGFGRADLVVAAPASSRRSTLRTLRESHFPARDSGEAGGAPRARLLRRRGSPASDPPSRTRGALSVQCSVCQLPSCSTFAGART